MISLINKLELEHGVALNEVRYIMICCCLPPERQGGGISYLNITIIHVTSFRSQNVLDEILQRTVKLLFQSFVPRFSSHPSVITQPVTGSVFHHFYRFGLN